MLQTFKIRDFRNKAFFMVDDEYLNGYARLLGTTASMIYFVLCRHADKDQVSFPSQKYIAEKLNINKRTVLDKIKTLCEWNLIKIERTRNNSGQWLHNTYVLLDKSEWKKKPDAENIHMDEPCAEKIHLPGAGLLQHKETHIKETHTLSIGKKGFSLKELEKDDILLTRIGEDYKVPVAFVRSKLDDLVNYCGRTGRKYKNYYMALRNFVKQDALKIRKGVNAQSKITVIRPDSNWNS